MPTRRARGIRVVTSLLLDLVLPFALCCGLRVIGIGQWPALALGEALPLARLAYGLATWRRLSTFPVCALAVAVGAHLVG